MTMLSEESKRNDRILIDESVMDIYRELRADAKSQPEQAPFPTFKDIFMLAACLGYQSGQRQQVPPGDKTDIRVSVFNESDMALLKAIAISETGDVNVLANVHTVMEIAEEYAHGGIHDVKSYLIIEGGRPLYNLLDLIVNTSNIS